MIQGPKHPGIDIDVFLEHLMQEMETLWRHGTKIMDGFIRKESTLSAIIYVSINDYQV
jgi:Fe2+ transport system protein B